MLSIVKITLPMLLIADFTMGVKMETAAEVNTTHKRLAQTAAEGQFGDAKPWTCYAYETTVVRRSAEGTNETVPIEDVEEGDYILAKGTQGLFFTEAIVVDLHPASNSEALTLKMNSG